MAGNDVYLYIVPSDSDADDVRLRDPTTSAASGAYTLDVLPATVAITGQSISLRASRNLSVNPATVAIVGQSISLVLTRKINVSPATVSIAGQSVALAVGRKLAVAPATVAITGQSVDLVHTSAGNAYALDVLPATVAIVGQSIDLVYAAADLDIPLTFGAGGYGGKAPKAPKKTKRAKDKKKDQPAKVEQAPTLVAARIEPKRSSVTIEEVASVQRQIATLATQLAAHLEDEDDDDLLLMAA